MIRVSVVYPSGPGMKFDWQYYMDKHIPAVRKLTPMGLVRVEVDKGMASAQPGAPAPFLCMAHLHFNNMDDMQKCMASMMTPTPRGLIADSMASAISTVSRSCT